MAKNHYLGIDLGTTNSCVAFGAFDAFSQKVMPEVIAVQMPGIATAQLLVPSVVMYERGQLGPVEIGLNTKDKLRQGLYDEKSIIVKSVKLQMGTKKVKEVPWLSPEQVSADILTFLKAAAERKFQHAPADVVIGVPACFNTDMWSATKKAAEIAGFRNIYLIDEPKAALLDFIRDQERFTPESRALDFSEPRTICVFDPGGGTIDVSIVKVRQVAVKKSGRTLYEMQFEDLGLTRQPFLGGDDFDKLLADFLANKLFDQTGVRINDIPNEHHRVFAQGKLLEFAEAAKKGLTDKVESLKTWKKLPVQEAMNEAFYEVQVPFVYQSYSLSYHLTYREYIDIISPLIAPHLQLSDIDRPEIRRKLAYQEDYQKSDNIVIPIFDALYKAKLMLGHIPTIDAVLVSGGMSKMHILRKRLVEFFGDETPIIEVPSPDLSVARGATIYHYNLVNGLLGPTVSLLPDAIVLETGAGFIPLVPAQTKYPATFGLPKGFVIRIPRDSIPHLDIPLWRGEPPRPTAKLIDRRIKFGDKASELRKGDVVEMQITIDTNRQLKLEAWLQKNPKFRFEVITDA